MPFDELQLWLTQDSIFIKRQLRDELTSEHKTQINPLTNNAEYSPQAFEQLIGSSLQFRKDELASELHLYDKDVQKHIFNHSTLLRGVFVGILSQNPELQQLAFIGLLRDNGEMVSLPAA